MNYAEKISNDIKVLLSEIKSLKSELEDCKSMIIKLDPNASFENELSKEVEYKPPSGNDSSLLKWVERNTETMDKVLNLRKQGKILSSIAKELNDIGVTTLTKKPITEASLSGVINALLRNGFINSEFNKTALYDIYF